MNLIPISPNLLINPDDICYVEQRKTKSGTTIKVGIADKEFEVDVPLDEFWKSIGMKAQSSSGQHFAG